jgi:hypothetical protein
MVATLNHVWALDTYCANSQEWVSLKSDHELEKKHMKRRPCFLFFYQFFDCATMENFFIENIFKNYSEIKISKFFSMKSSLNTSLERYMIIVVCHLKSAAIMYLSLTTIVGSCEWIGHHLPGVLNSIEYGTVGFILQFFYTYPGSSQSEQTFVGQRA